MKLLVVIFFKQKTAYEMRISDWSSDVCSSDLPLALKSRMDEGIEILPIFRLRWLENRGVSMGFFHAETDVMRWLLVGMTMVIAAFVGVWLWREKARQDVAALGLVLGGARKRVGVGKGVSVGVEPGCRRIIKQNNRN